MAIHTYEGATGLKAALVDGYLKDRPYLLKRANDLDREIKALPENKRCSLREKPYQWNDWDEDALFEYIAYNSRGQFCGNRPPEKSGYIWSEAWLLKPAKWEKGFTLNKAGGNPASRRLLIALYDGCAYGDSCLSHVIERSGLESIPARHYKNIQAFKQQAGQLLDEISLPFQAPCLSARKIMEGHGYTLRAFGS